MRVPVLPTISGRFCGLYLAQPFQDTNNNQYDTIAYHHALQDGNAAPMSAKAKLADSQARYRDERRQLLMDAAAEVIAKQGVHSTTMDDISASLGMTKIVLYRTFGTRDKLIESILERVTDELLGVDALGIEKYGERLYRYLTVCRQYASSMRILLLQTPHDDQYNKQYKKLSRQLVRRTRERIEERQERGETACSLDVDFISESIVSFILDSISRWLKHGRTEQDEEFVNWMLLSRAAMENPGMVPVEHRPDN